MRIRLSTQGPFVIGALLVVLLWLLYLVALSPEGIFGYVLFNEWKDAGVFGDSFGALTCLFSALAFAGVVFSIWRDHQEKRRENKREYYKSLIEMLDAEINTVNTQGEFKVPLHILRSERNYYADRFKRFLTQDRLPNDAILKAFMELGVFDKATSTF